MPSCFPKNENIPRISEIASGSPKTQLRKLEIEPDAK